MKSATNRIGIVGLSEGRSILSAVSTSPHWEVGNMCDLHEELCRQRAAEFNLDRWTTRYADLLEDPTIDTIAIFTPDALHADHAIAAMHAGKDVICTKPVIKGLASGERLWAVAQQTGRRFMAGHSSRFFGTAQRQHADFATGRLGRLLTVEAHYHGDKRPTLGDPNSWKKNWLYTGIIHPADLVLWYLPDLDEVFGYATTSSATRNAEMPDTYHFVARSPTGAVGRISGCYSSAEMPRASEAMVECVLRCENGTSMAENPTFRYHTHVDGEAPLIHTYDEEYPYYFRFGEYRHHAGEFQNYLDHFAVCRAAGVRARPDLGEALRSIALLEAMAESLQKSCPVRVSDILRRHNLGDLAFAPSAVFSDC